MHYTTLQGIESNQNAAAITYHAAGVPDHGSNSGICSREEQRRTGLPVWGGVGQTPSSKSIAIVVIIIVAVTVVVLIPRSVRGRCRRRVTKENKSNALHFKGKEKKETGNEMIQ